MRLRRPFCYALEDPELIMHTNFWFAPILSVIVCYN